MRLREYWGQDSGMHTYAPHIYWIIAGARLIGGDTI